MRESLILAVLIAFAAAAPPAQAQSALEKLKAAEKANKKELTPEEKAKAEAAKAKAEAEKAKAEAEKAKAEAAKAKADAEKAKADADKAAKEKGDKEKADKEKADKEKADAEKAAKEKADKEKADKAKADKADAGKAEEKAEEKADKDAPEALIKLRTTRDERRKASIEKLKARWGVLAENGNAKDELERHARFVANLQRIRALAEEKKKLKLIEKVDQLLTKEELRHASQMNKLRDAAPAGGAK